MDKEDKTTVIIKTNLYKLLSFVTHNLIRVTFVIWLVLDPCLLKAGDSPAAVCFCNSVFVRTSTSPVALAKAVAADLLGMSTDCTTAGKAKSAEQAIPCSYQRGLTEIHYVPYENIGMVTGYGILRLYLPWILVIFILLLVIVIFSVYTVRMKIRFKQVTPLRCEQAMRESEAKLREAQEMAHLGYWYWDIKTGEVEWSEEIYKIFRQDPREFIPQIDSIMKLSPWAEDSQRNKELITRAMENHEQGNFEQKFLRPDGSIGYYFSTYRGIYDNNDNLIAMKGTVQDITEKKMVEVTILENEQKFRSIYESSRDAIVILDEDSFLDCNVAALQMFGYASKETFCRYHPADVSPAFQPDGRSSRQKADDMIMAAIQGRSEIFEWIYQRKDGSDFPTEILLSPIKWEGKEAILAVVRDITDRKQAEEVLRESEAKYRIMFSMAQAGIMITTVENGEIIECNTRLANIFGYDSVEQCKAEFVIEDHYVDTQQRKVLVEALKKNGEIRDFEIRITRRDGVEIWAIVSSALYPSKEIIGSVIVDVTEQKQTQLMIEKSLAEKEILLRELYHRTKNNMQVIIAMLELQTEYTENKHIDEIFTDIKNRIKAMSMVHQHLYQAENLSKINLKQYIDDLVEKLIKSFHLPEDKIKYRPSMSDVWVLIDFAMPFGLILNELITNSCKHAFPDKQKGEIVIKLNRTNSNNIYLLVSDNGIGPPPGFDLKIHSKLGLHNVVSLVKYQLYGKVTFNFENGFLCEIEFKDDIYRERV